MKIAFVGNRYFNSSTPAAWSGLPFFMRRSLERAGLKTVDCVLEEPFLWAPLAEYALRRLAGQRSLRGCHEQILKNYAAQLARRLEILEVDAVFSPSSWLVAYLKTEIPVFFWTDACVAGMLNFYESFSGLPASVVRAAHEAERSALTRCTGAFYASDWAAQTALHYYRPDPAKVHVVPFGGNLLEFPQADEIARSIESRSTSRCELLLIGVDWKRKGVDRAIAATAGVLARNRPARLTVVGCTPPRGTKLPDYVHVIPFISKNTPEGGRQLAEIYARSHFFIMPSRAEAYGLVFAEANAYGLPCLAPLVGGIPSIISNGINGQLFSLQADEDDYAKYIVELMDNYPRYKVLASQSAGEARNRLNWDCAGQRVAGLLKASVDGKQNTRVLASPTASPHHVTA